MKQKSKQAKNTRMKHPELYAHNETNIREIIFGAEDGFVSTLGLILGMATATNESRIVIIAGIVYVIAEAFSMAAGTYLSTKAQKEFYMSELRKEKEEIEQTPGEEEDEVREIYWNKGFRGRFLEKIVSKITSRKDLWLKVMLEEELKVFPETVNPIKNSIAMFLASIFAGAVPVIPFLFLAPAPAAAVSIFVTLVALFVTGAVKALYVQLDWKRSGVEMLVVGAFAAAIGYVVGLLTGKL
jgi:VIT1/CCC1 family predicted Fe2+/Mn2+ transporter